MKQNSDDDALQIDGYNLVRSDNPNNASLGGVCVYYKSILPITLRPNLTSLDECVVLELKVGNKKCFITCLYRSPSLNNKDNVDEFIINFEKTINNIEMKNPYLSLILGDFNAKNTSCWGNINDYQGIQIEQVTGMYGYCQLINEPTNYEPHCEPSCIDLIFSSQPNLIQRSGTYASLFDRCHHQIIYAEVNFKVFYPPPYKRKLWDYKNADINKINESLSRIDWENHFRTKDLNEQVKFLNDCIINVCSNYCPNKIIICRDKDAKWMTDDIKKLLREKEKNYKTFVKNEFKQEDKAKLKSKQRECSKDISEAKEGYLIKEGGKLNDPLLGPKKYWALLNTFLNKKKIPLIPPILEDNVFITDAKLKADLFNTYFASQCVPFTTGSQLPPIYYRTESRLSDLIISTDMMLSIINSLNPNKSHGCDNISIKMIQICRNVIVFPLKIIFDNCVKTGLFPDLWKMSNVCPVYKKGSKNLTNNYRPISLLPVFSKILEKIIYDTLYSYCINNKLLTTCQSGFQQGDSCVSQLLKITHDIYKNLDANPPVITRSVFLDMSKAFDKVWHEGLLFKLTSYGVQGNLLNLLTNYIHGRKQRVTMNGQESNWKDIQSGVPQGSVLGPLLFLLYVNDLPDNLQCNPKLFDDDVSLNEHVSDIEVSTARLSQDLLNIEQWAYQWKMAFNPDPAKAANEVLFCNRNGTNMPKLSFVGNVIQPVESHKHLGLILDSKLTFNQHIKEKINKANYGILMIRKLHRYLPRNALVNIFKSFVRPHLEYCDIIYHKPCADDIMIQNAPQNNVSQPNLIFTNKLESVQYNAALAITGCIRGTSKEKLYNELGFMSLYDRRTFHRLLQFYKIKNGLLPEYLKNEIPDDVPRLHNTRHQRGHVITTRTNKYLYSFFPHSMNVWTALSNFIKLSPSVSTFKKRYMDFYNADCNPVYNVHNPLGLKLLHRLRTGLSHLREHKHKDHFKDTVNPFCLCDGRTIESTEHYLLRCPNYDHCRIILFEELTKNQGLLLFFRDDTITTNILLYGINIFSALTNKMIIEATINFLLSSFRFREPLITG